MKNKIKKILVCSVVSCMALVPVLTYAASSYCTGGIGITGRFSSYTFSDYSHSSVCAYHEKFGVVRKSSGWEHTATNPLYVEKSIPIYGKYGYNGSYIASISSY